ncbi:MAG TPA: amidase [Solirubrobacteraceae bacterium]|jgi:amidase|nr:amidase [Solirubrobacteraceae bacterium]
MDAADLAFAGAVRQSELVRRGEVSARELVELYLERIDRLDPLLNAYRVVFRERALAEADQADARARAGDTRPLLGVPIGIKDDLDVAGEATALGLAPNGTAPADAELVRRLRTAGAVILGKTHLPELGITPWTESLSFGATRNPWDVDRTPGGSSGGSAAVVAAGLAGAAIGSDGAGSVRIPAACCGVFGLKAQHGRVPTAPAVEPFCGLATWGPLTRGVADSALVFDAIKDGGPSFAEAAGREPGRLRIAVSVRTPPMTGVQADEEQLSGVRALTGLLRDLGHAVIEREIPYAPALAGNVIVRYLRGIADRGRSLDRPERLSRQVRGYVRMGTAIPATVVERAKAAAATDAEALDRVFDGGVDLVLTPMFTRRPPRVGEYAGRSALWAFTGSVRFVPYCGAYNHTGQPAASVPATWTADGFPVGAQLVAQREGEPVLLSLAAQLERELGWLDRRPGVAG